MKITRLYLFVIILSCPNLIFSQFEQDSTLNNLIHEEGYLTSKWGSFSYEVFGDGERSMFILPGSGFGASLFQKFIEDNWGNFTMYVVRLPGYSGTQAYPIPPEEESYSEQNWTDGVMAGILQLMEEKNIEKPIIMGHFMFSAKITMRLATEHGDKFGKAIVIGTPAELKNPPPYDTLGYENRVKFTDKYLAPLWFKTVTRKTWLEGNYTPETYSLDTTMAKQFWQQANDAPLPVHIQYLCENWCYDFANYANATIPVLVMVPSFQSDVLAMECNQYMSWWAIDKWKELAAKNNFIMPILVDGSACNIMYDQPDVFQQLISDFLN